MNFQNPEYFWLLGAIPILFILFYLEKRFLKGRLSRIAPLTHLGLLVAKGLQTPSRGMLALRVVGVVFLITSLTRPSWTFKWQEVKHEGIDVMVLLDVSKSMLAEDISPNRLQRAKRKLQDLLGLMRGDRFGLVVFAGSAHVEVPLTIDYSAARQFIENVDLSSVPYQGTNMGAAIELAAASLNSAALSKQEGGQGKAILLLTDGEDHTGFAQKAALDAKDKGVKIFTVGIGSQRGAPIPLPRGGFQKDSSGNVVMSKYDANLLKELASITGGVFAKSVAGDLDLNTIYVNGIRKKFETQLLNEQRLKNWLPQSHWFTIIGVIFMILSLGWEKRRMLSTTAVFFFGLLAAAPSPGALANAERDAYESYQEGNFKEAEKKYLEAERKDPHNPEIIYNRAVTQYKNGNFKGAKKGFERVEKLAQSKELKNRAKFNLGNTYFRMQKPDDAIKAYESLLKDSPDQKQAKENLRAALQYKKMLEQQKKQQQSGNSEQNQDQKKQQSNQDQQSQKQQQGNQNQNQNQDRQQQGQRDKQQSQKADAKSQQNQDKNKSKQEDSQNRAAEAKEKGKKEEEQKQGARENSEPKDPEEEKQRAKLNPQGNSDAEKDEKQSEAKQNRAKLEKNKGELNQEQESTQKDSHSLDKSAKTLTKEEALRYLRTLKEGSPRGKKFSNQKNASQDGKDW